MEYAYATLLLNESNREINETNLTAVLEASGCAVETSRIKALVAALEDVDLDGVVPADVDSGHTSTTADADADSRNEEPPGTPESQPGDDAPAET